MARSPAIRLANALVAVAGACVIAVGAWHWTSPAVDDGAAETRAPATDAALAEPEPPAIDATAIAGWHLFGELSDDAEDETPVPAGVADVESMDAIPDSTIRLEVTGTVVATHDEAARAIVKDASGTQREYRIGDTLPGNVELHAVERSRIVIRRNGALEAIALPKPEDLVPATESGPAASPRRRGSGLVINRTPRV